MMTRCINTLVTLILLSVFCAADSPHLTALNPSRDRAIKAMRIAAGFYHSKVASHGGYVYHYSIDLSQRWGEGVASKDQIWVQPPGTPTVGMAFLRAYQSTNDQQFLDAAQDAALALVAGQLKSGGWTNSIDFDPKGSLVADYRNRPGRGKNNSSLDDGQTQSALLFLIQLDDEISFSNSAIHQVVEIGLDALLAAQFRSGGFERRCTLMQMQKPSSERKTIGTCTRSMTMSPVTLPMF